MRFVECNHAAHAEPILAILNDAIASSTALYDYRPRPASSMVEWFAEKARGNYPVLGALGDDGELAGFATYGPFRARAAYKYSIEHSVYVAAGRRGHGIGGALLRRLIDAARTQQYHVMVGGIDAGNRASIVLHERAGFVHAGTIRHAGYKFARWLDLAFYQLILVTPEEPRDD
jgi:phosphinothricin acetyltransferase